MSSVSQSAAPFPPTPSSSDPNAPVPGRNGEPISNSLDLEGLDTRLAEKHRSLRPSMASEASNCSDDSTYSLNTEYHGPLIPPTYDKSYRRRTVVLCFDGTGDQFDLDNSNVIQFFSVLKKGDRKRQLVYYQSGIGTYTIPQVATPLYSRLSKTLDLMFANNLDHHVMSGYNFLMENFKDGDKICIFGFSRGAYVARALAGMIHKVGLLPAGNNMQVPFAYKMFKNDSELGWRQSVAFKRTFSMDVDIDFVGVWDTVASVGLLPTTLPFTKSNTAIKVFRHALSLDEHRTKFKPSIYQKITAEEARRGDFKPPPTRQSSPIVTRGRKPTVTNGRKVEVTKEVTTVEGTRSETAEIQGDKNGEEAKTTVTKIKRSSRDERRSESGSPARALLGSIRRQARDISDNVKAVVERASSDRERSKSRDDVNKENLSPDSERDQLEQMYLDRSRPTDVLEVWFAGCHCDVGGGSVPNSTPNNLARIPLRWMIRECFLARTGIQFEADRLRDLGIDPTTLYPRVMKIPHPENFESPAPIETPLPALQAPPPSAVSPPTTQPLVNSIPVTESPPKEQPPRTESTAEVDGAQGSQDAVTVIKAEETVIENDSDEVKAPDMTEEHSRTNNVSMDATLVESDKESLEAPGVRIESASVIELNEAFRSVPHLEGCAPAHEDTLKPIPEPTRPRFRTRKSVFSRLEAGQDVLDARCEVYDQLKLAKWWWLLEFIPFRERVQQEDGTYKKKWSINRGRARMVHQAEPLHVHRSVKMRMENKDLKYKPRLKFEKEPIWVD